MTLGRDAKLEEELIFGLENNKENLANFQQSTCNFQNGDFNGILLSNVENILS